ncbi:MAG: glycosyltransferase family 39 protein [Anaerolineales bacterium]
MRALSIKLIAILLLAGALRALAVIVVQETHVSWQYEYEEIAYNLAERGEYAYSFYGLSETRPTSFQPPLYPLFLATLLKLGRGSMETLAPVQILLSVLSIWALFRLSMAAGGSERLALLAALLMAVYPPLILYAVIPSVVTLETLFILAGTWFTFRSTQVRAFIWPLAAGVSFALAGLTRSPWLVAIPVALIWLIWRDTQSGWRRLRTPLLLSCAAVITLIPWAFHNSQVHGAWSITGTNGGLNFWIGNNPDATGEYIFPTEIDRELILEVAEWPERDRDRFFYQQGFDFIRENPGQALRLFIQKLQFFSFFRPSIGSTYQNTDLQVALARNLFITSWMLILPAGLAGLWIARHRWADHALLVGIILSQAFVTSLYFVGTRFRTPLEPYFMIWTAGFLVWIVEKLTRKWESKHAA